jgi:hypothetical protein
MSHPAYKIEGPALISFSGGRTSAFMLHEIIRAHGGSLPDDVKVAFANTGKEREETLRFVYECSVLWNVKVHWLEWCDAKPCFEVVGYNSASRSGEPFAALIAKKKRLPNWQERWCTEYLKVRPLTAFAQQQGWATGAYAEIIGLRHDEGLRILRGMDNAEKHGRRCVYPLSRAKITRSDVLSFWKAQPFDLGLQSWEGNCDLCFMKGRGLRKRIIRDNPHAADWWNDQEQVLGGSFDRRDRVNDLIQEVRRSPELFDEIADEEHDAECGLLCGAAA